MSAVFGREQELALVDAFLESASERGYGALLLEGGAGIGKTTIWRAAVERARQLDFHVLEARPAESEGELSFAALADLLAGTHDEIGELPQPQRRALRIALVLEGAAGEVVEQRTVAAALLGLLGRLSRARPLLIALDDVQWLDPPSAGALQFAVRRLGEEPVRVLASVRQGAPVLDFENPERIAVGPLPLHALAQLIHERLGGARFLRPTLRQLEEASGGNPFFALEIAARLQRTGRRLTPGEPLPIPPSLRELVSDRLSTLTPDAREAALAAAVLAQPTVAAVQQITSGGFAAVAEAVSAGVLERDGETLRFTHPLLASTLYGDSPPEERRTLHGRLAGVVGDAEERARHLAAAAAGPDERLAGTLEAAARDARARGAPDAAVRLVRQAVELTPPDRRLELHRRRLHWARYTFAAGDPKQAEELLERQLELTDFFRERAEVELELGKARLATGGASAARVCYERALRELEDSEADELRTMILIELASMDLTEYRLDSDTAEQAVACAETIAEPSLLARALGTYGLKLTLLGQPPPEEYWRRALELEEATGELRLGGPTNAYGFAALMLGDAQTWAESMEQIAASMRHRSDPLLPSALLGMSGAARESGDWERAAHYVREAHDLAVQTGLESLESACLSCEADLASQRGDLELARRRAEEALALAERQDSYHTVWTDEAAARCLLGRIATISGRHEEAHHHFIAALMAAEHLGGLFELVAELLAEDVECLVALGELEEASRQSERLVEFIATLRMPWLEGRAARAQGLLASAEGDLEAALRQLEQAVESFESLALPMPLELGRTLLVRGQLERRARKKLHARGTLERALEIFERLGARLWIEKARAELRKLGGRPSRPGALSATEQSIADLVAAGRSNAEVARELFLSPKTVEWNLSKVYRKLHVRSRTELTAKLARKASLSQ